MYAVTTKFNLYSSLSDRLVQAKVVINDVEFGSDSVVDFIVEDSLITDEDFELGSAVSSTLSLTLKTSSLISNNAKIEPFVRFLNSAGDPTEWLPLGVFFVDSRKKQGGVWKFSAFDKLILTQVYYETALTFPNTMAQVLTEICANLGIEKETSVNVNAAYVIQTKPEYGIYTCRDMIRFIASSCGRCARMSKNGKLDFVDISGRVPVKTVTASDVIRCEEINPERELTKLILNYDSELEPFIVGDGDLENTMWAYNPYATQAIAEYAYTQIDGLTYMPLNFSSRCLPQIEVGDLISVVNRSTTYTTIVLRSKIKFAGGLLSDIQSPSSTAQESEFGFDGSIGAEISKVGSRIGLFAQAINKSNAIIRTTLSTFLYIPITTSAETDIEFIIAIMGAASVAGVVTIELKLEGSSIGMPWRHPVTIGENMLSLSFLIRRIPKVSGVITLMLKMSSGTFTIAKNEGQFNLYGGNLVMDSSIPYLVFEDIVESIVLLEGDVTAVLYTPITRSMSDEISAVVIQEGVVEGELE